MDSISVYSKPFLLKLQENIQRVDKRIDDYIDDSSDTNIHNIRTSIRRLDASFRTLPKKARKGNRIRNYIKQCRLLFKINSKIRDYDIICKKLEPYSSQPIYTNLIESLKKRRNGELRKARDIAFSLRKLRLPKISKIDISKKKLNRRFNKTISRFSDKIELNFPVVLVNSNRKRQLHEMRKDCKKLRYLLELHSYQSKEADKTISELEKIQDMLGSIRDYDIAITHLRRIKRHSKEVSHILDDMITQRAHKYDEFVEFYRNDLSYSKQNFSQIWTFT